MCEMLVLKCEMCHGDYQDTHLGQSKMHVTSSRRLSVSSVSHHLSSTSYICMLYMYLNVFVQHMGAKLSVYHHTYTLQTAIKSNLYCCREFGRNIVYYISFLLIRVCRTSIHLFVCKRQTNTRVMMCDILFICNCLLLLFYFGHFLHRIIQMEAEQMIVAQRQYNT